MIGKKTGFILAISALVLGIMHPLLGDDFSPPPWQRGFTDGTTYQQWSFGTGDGATTPIAPDAFYNPYEGVLGLKVYGGPGWINQGPGGKQGIWQLGELDMLIPNNPNIAGYKEIRLQLTWMPANLDPFLPEEPLAGILTNPTFASMQMTRTDDRTGTDGWIRTLFEIDVTPNPISEWITVKGDILVDQVVVDTRCVPEPGTAILLGLGVTAAVRRRIRR